MSGVQTKRDAFLVDIDEAPLRARLAKYFDSSLSFEAFSALHPEATHRTRRYEPRETREILTKRGVLSDHVVRYCYRPFDVRWVYWEPSTKLLGEKSPTFFPNAVKGNLWIEAREKETKEGSNRGYVTSVLADNFGNGFSTFFPLHLVDGAKASKQPTLRFNLTQSLRGFLAGRNLPAETLFYHIVGILHSPSYRAENGGALRMDWPRIPLPSESDILSASAKLGSRLAVLLDPELPAPGISAGSVRPGLRLLGVPSKRDRTDLELADLSITAGWGSTQGERSGNAIVMPGRGSIVERDYTDSERASLEAEGRDMGLNAGFIFTLLGTRTTDIYLNEDAFWSNIPFKVWDYTLAGYPVIKKWLSYREQSVLGRSLKPDEVAYISEMVRRIAAILLMEPELDKNFESVKSNAMEWTEGRPIEKKPAG